MQHSEWPSWRPSAAALRPLLQLLPLPLISKAQATALLPYYEAVRAAKEVAVQAAVANDKQGVDLALQALASALDTYNAELAKAKLDHAKAATTKP